MENLGNGCNNTNFQAPYIAHLELNELESTFVEAVSDTLQQSRTEKKQNLFYLGTSESMQNGFENYVIEKFGAEKYCREKLYLEPIITSLWLKTKEQVESQLLKAKVRVIIFDEISWQVQADQLIEGCRKEGHTGKFFTERQIKVLLGENILNIEELFQTIIEEEPQGSRYCAIQ